MIAKIPHKGYKRFQGRPQVPQRFQIEVQVPEVPHKHCTLEGSRF